MDLENLSQEEKEAMKAALIARRKELINKQKTMSVENLMQNTTEAEGAGVVPDPEAGKKVADLNNLNQDAAKVAGTDKTKKTAEAIAGNGGGQDFADMVAEDLGAGKKRHKTTDMTDKQIAEEQAQEAQAQVDAAKGYKINDARVIKGPNDLVENFKQGIDSVTPQEAEAQKTEAAIEEGLHPKDLGMTEREMVDYARGGKEMSEIVDELDKFRALIVTKEAAVRSAKKQEGSLSGLRKFLGSFDVFSKDIKDKSQAEKDREKLEKELEDLKKGYNEAQIKYAREQMRLEKENFERNPSFTPDQLKNRMAEKAEEILREFILAEEKKLNDARFDAAPKVAQTWLRQAAAKFFGIDPRTRALVLSGLFAGGVALWTPALAASATLGVAGFVGVKAFRALVGSIAAKWGIGKVEKHQAKTGEKMRAELTKGTAEQMKTAEGEEAFMNYLADGLAKGRENLNKIYDKEKKNWRSKALVGMFLGGGLSAGLGWLDGYIGGFGGSKSSLLDAHKGKTAPGEVLDNRPGGGGTNPEAQPGKNAPPVEQQPGKGSSPVPEKKVGQGGTDAVDKKSPVAPQESPEKTNTATAPAETQGPEAPADAKPAGWELNAEQFQQLNRIMQEFNIRELDQIRPMSIRDLLNSTPTYEDAWNMVKDKREFFGTYDYPFYDTARAHLADYIRSLNLNPDQMSRSVNDFISHV